MNQSFSYNSNMNQDANLERGFTLNESNFPTINIQQPKKYSQMSITSPQPDFMNRSIASLFLCFVWGIFAFMSSNKVRKFNQLKAYDQAAYYSRNALKYNQSAVACFVILICIIGVPLAISLAVQGSVSKFPNARLFFG